MKKLIVPALLATLTALACTSEVSLGQGTDALGGLGEAPKADGTCAVRLKACSNVCVDVASNTNHCGTCGSVCGNGQTCQSGVCANLPVPPPPPPPGTCGANEVACGGICKNLAIDDSNCGVCGNACAATERCVRASCISTTPPPVATTLVRGTFSLRQSDRDVTTLLSMASMLQATITPGIAYGDCVGPATSTIVGGRSLEAPKQFSFQGGNSISPLTLLPLAASPEPGRYACQDNRLLGQGGSPTWLQAGQTLTAQSVATVDVPALRFPALAWPSRVKLVASPTFNPGGDGNSRIGSTVGRAAAVAVAWSVEDPVSVGVTQLQIVRQDNSFRLNCTAPVAARSLTISPAALSALGAGSVYMYAGSSNSAAVPVAGFDSYNYAFVQSEAGRNDITNNGTVVFQVQ